MQVRCPLCWEMYNDQQPHRCWHSDHHVPTCSPAPPEASSAKNRVTLTLYTSDAIKFRDCLRHMGKLATLIGMQSSVFFDTLLGVESSLTNALQANGTEPLTKSLLKKSTPTSPPQPANTSETSIRAAVSAVRFLREWPHPCSSADLASKLKYWHPELTEAENRLVASTVLGMWK